ncbi:YibE/F family protein [Patescibacteria group bacterium]|nr:YibE/F family protein [Patescibacteria group bacterium]
MNKILRLKLIFLLLLLFLLTPVFVLAQNSDEIFKAEVIEILQEKEITSEDGLKLIQQNILLKGLEDKWQDKEIIFQGIDDYQVMKNNIYKVNDKVLVAFSPGPENEENYYITDYIRYQSLYWLAFVFVLLVILIGKWKGIRAVVGVLASFFVIMKIIVPKILMGTNPLLISIFGSILILLLVVYLTEGINKKSHLAVLSITLSLIIVGIFSVVFTNISKLTGFAQEEAMFLISFGKSMINFKGLLLAGIIIGTLGVLDDAVISQIASVKQIKNANSNLSKKEVYKNSMKIGVSHMSSMINTLFLVYAGASLPLLLLFTINEPPFLTFNQIINNEIIAVEIVRTLAGSIGLILSIPIATFLASWFLNIKKY